MRVWWMPCEATVPEFAKQQPIDVVVEADGDLAISDSTTALCLYRVVQEALRNIAKHANARRCTSRCGASRKRCSSVADDGTGFDLAKAHELGGGLGLRSIEERVRLVGGRPSIDTAPRMGTTLTVRVRVLASPARELAGV